jgi:hypothetical protein
MSVAAGGKTLSADGAYVARQAREGKRAAILTNKN